MSISRTALQSIGYALAFTLGMLATGPALAQFQHANSPCAAKAAHVKSMQNPAQATSAQDPDPIPWELLRGGP